MIPRPENPVIVAIDGSDLERAEDLAQRLAGEVGALKIGLELFSAFGPEAVRRIGRHGPVFLDLKLHDIPNTVRGAARNVGRLGVAMLTVHALGGEAMVAAAVEGAADGAAAAGVGPPIIIGVTVLSSLSGESLASPASLAFEAHAAGAGAAVVSGEDVESVREAMGEAFGLVVPGIRPAGANGDDQVRILTPAEAIASGADWLVVGRPITRAEDPLGALRMIRAQAAT